MFVLYKSGGNFYFQDQPGAIAKQVNAAPGSTHDPSTAVDLPSGVVTAPAGAEIDTGTGKPVTVPPVSAPGSSTSGTRNTRYPTGYTPGYISDLGATAPPKPGAAPSEADIQAKTAAEYQSEIDAINSYYDTLVSGQKVTNENNAGRTRASSAASGVLGSTFGDQAGAATDQAGQDALAKVQAARDSAIANVTATIKSNAEQEYQFQVQEIDKQSTTYINFLTQKATDAKASIASLAASGASLNDLPQDTYDQLFKDSGFNSPEEMQAYYNQQAAAAKAAAEAAAAKGEKTVAAGSTLVDAKGNPIASGAPKVSSIGARGSIVYDPKTQSYTVVQGTATPGAGIKAVQGGLYDTANNKWIVPPNPNANKATGWTKASTDQQLAAYNWLSQQPGFDPNADPKALTSDPAFFLHALNSAYAAGVYTPVSLGAGATTSTPAQ